MLASKDHFRSIRDFTQAQFMEFSTLLFATRQAMGDLNFCDDISIVQEERSIHFHYWLFPRYPWMSERFGNSLSSIREIMNHVRETQSDPDAEAAAVELAERLRPTLQNRICQALKFSAGQD